MRRFQVLRDGQKIGEGVEWPDGTWTERSGAGADTFEARGASMRVFGDAGNTLRYLDPALTFAVSGWQIERREDGVWAKEEDGGALVGVRSDDHGGHDLWIWAANPEGQCVPLSLIRHLERIAREERP